MNQKNNVKRVEHFEEEFNIAIMMSQLRTFKKRYEHYRRTYFEELERILCLCFMQYRTMSITESNSMEKIYKDYLDNYFKYLQLRERLSHYGKILKELRCI